MEALFFVLQPEKPLLCSMSIEWKLIYTDNDYQRIVLMRNFLEEQGVEAQIINKIDSLYPSIGSAELYVNANATEQAIALLNAREEDLN